MKLGNWALLAVTFLAATLPGCASARDDDSTYIHDRKVEPISEAELGAMSPDYVPLSATTTESGTPAPPAPAPSGEEGEISALNAEELADKLRPVVYDVARGQAYIQRSITAEDVERAREALRSLENPVEHTETPIPAARSAPTAPGVKPQNIWGTDDRVATTDCSLPSKAVYRLQGLGCTGTVIGWRTLITAAHCVYARGSGWVWYQNISVKLASACGSLSNFTFSGGLVTVPQAYITGGDPAYDYAVVDFGTWATPISQTGTVSGVVVDQTGTHNYTAFGYGRFDDGRLTRTTGSGYKDTSFFYSRNIDAGPGDSGGPWIWTSGGDWVAGTLIGNLFDWCGFLGSDRCVYSGSRRIDSVYWSSIKAWSQDF
jgi:V8-like Glu-specific endopeptidase